MHNETFTVTPAAYAKGKMVVRCRSNSGFKTRSAYLAEALGGRFVGRSGGYHMSPAAVEKLRALHEAGFDAHVQIFDRGPCRFHRGGTEPVSLREALAISKNEGDR